MQDRGGALCYKRISTIFHLLPIATGKKKKATLNLPLSPPKKSQQNKHETPKWISEGILFPSQKKKKNAVRFGFSEPFNALCM